MDFVKSYFGKNEPLTSWTPHICPPFFSDLEKNWGQKCSTGQRFIFTEITFYKIHILICQKPAHFLSAQMALVSTFFQMFIVLGMYNFADRSKPGWAITHPAHPSPTLLLRIVQRCMKIPMLQRNHSGYSRIFFPRREPWRQWKQVSKRLRESVCFCSDYFLLSSPL